MEEQTLKVGSTVTFKEATATVRAMDLPRMTLEFKGHRKQSWNKEWMGQVIEIAGYSFFVKAIAGKRMYLIKVKIEENADA